jgi:hypothetical protein
MELEQGGATHAYQYLADLQQEAGARLAGSAGEARARAWLCSRLERLGLEPIVEEFRYRGDDRLASLKSLFLALGVVALTLLSLRANPWVILLGMVGVFVTHSLVFKALERRTAETVGANILAGVTRPWLRITSESSPKVIFLCAHYDTAPSAPAWRLRIRGTQDAMAGLAFLGVLALALYCLVQGLLIAFAGSFGWAAVWATGLLTIWRSTGVWIVLAAGLPATIVVFLTVATYEPPSQRPENPGADDNGSGVAVVLSLVEALKRERPAGWDIAAAFWGAEESGLWGSDAFVGKYGKHLSSANTIVVNVDTVGRGQSLMAVAGEGVVRRRAVDADLLQKWEQACRQVGAGTIREWLTPLAGSSDHAAWLNAGFAKALSVGRGDLVPIAAPIRVLNHLLVLPTGPKQTGLAHIHSPQDDLAGIRQESLEETSRALLQLMSLLP